jgi:replicative DNA helicase
VEAERGMTLPHSKDAERAVLGAVLREPDTANLVVDKLKAEHFFLDIHTRIFEAIVELYQRNEPSDILTVADRLRSKADGENVIGPAYLIELTENCPVAQNVEYYAGMVRDYFYLRRIIDACQKTIRKAVTCDREIKDFVEEVEKEFLAIASQQERSGLTAAVEVLDATIQDLEQKLTDDTGITGVSSGFNDLDRITGGFQRSDLIILAARPGMGKTAFVLNCAMNAVKKKHPVAIFTLEMSKKQLMLRLLSAEARIDSSRLRRVDLTEDEQNRLMHGARTIGALPAMLAIDETGGINLLELRSRCRKFKKEHGLDLIIIDYLQLMQPAGNRKSDSREREISEISGGLKNLAKELDVPIVALAQLNRGPDARPDKRPKMSDLRESGSMEQDADLIAFIYRDEYYNKASEDVGKAELILAKNRHGSTATVMMAYQPNFVSFHNLLQD